MGIRHLKTCTNTDTYIVLLRPLYLCFSRILHAGPSSTFILPCSFFGFTRANLGSCNSSIVFAEGLHWLHLSSQAWVSIGSTGQKRSETILLIHQNGEILHSAFQHCIVYMLAHVTATTPIVDNKLELKDLQEGNLCLTIKVYHTKIRHIVETRRGKFLEGSQLWQILICFSNN